MSSSWIRIERRLAIYLRDELTCIWCLADLHHEPAENVTLDHITPKSKNGTNACLNLITSCKRCNSTRRSMYAKDFALYPFVAPNAMQRINSQRRKKINKSLAFAIINGRTPLAEAIGRA